MTIAKLTRQATEAEAVAEALAEAEPLVQALVKEGLCRPDEADDLLETKELGARAKWELGDQLTGYKPRSLKTRARRKPSPVLASYDGLEGAWASHLEVAQTYEGKLPAQDRDDFRHDCIIELDRATKRDGKPLPKLRAYRIASLMVALHYRVLHRYSTRVCVYNGYPTDTHCKACQNKSEGKRCCWLATRPVERLDGEIIDDDGYAVKLLDTVASDKIEDMPDKWTEINEVRQGLPLRLIEIAYQIREGKPLSVKDRQYLSRYRRQAQKALF